MCAMYSFVRGARLYVKGSRDPRDPDDVPDPGEQQLATNRTQMASASQESRETFRSSHVRSGLKTVHTSRVVRKTTTMTRGEQSQLAIEQQQQQQRQLESSATQTRSDKQRSSRSHKVRSPATGCRRRCVTGPRAAPWLPAVPALRRPDPAAAPPPRSRPRFGTWPPSRTPPKPRSPSLCAQPDSPRTLRSRLIASEKPGFRNGTSARLSLSA